jgi:hypothetical protein
MTPQEALNYISETLLCAKSPKEWLSIPYTRLKEFREIINTLSTENQAIVPKYKVNDWCWFISNSTLKIAKKVRIKKLQVCCVVIEDEEFVFKISELELYNTQQEAEESLND